VGASSQGRSARVSETTNPRGWTNSRFSDVGFALSASPGGLATTQEIPYRGAKSTYGEHCGLVQPSGLLGGSGQRFLNIRAMCRPLLGNDRGTQYEFMPEIDFWRGWGGVEADIKPGSSTQSSSTAGGRLFILSILSSDAPPSCAASRLGSPRSCASSRRCGGTPEEASGTANITVLGDACCNGASRDPLRCGLCAFFGERIADLPPPPLSRVGLVRTADLPPPPLSRLGLVGFGAAAAEDFSRDGSRTR
jgi:hypothetical protein